MRKLFLIPIILCLCGWGLFGTTGEEVSHTDYTADAAFQWGWGMDADESPVQDISAHNFDLVLKGDGEPDWATDADNGGGYVFDGTDDYLYYNVTDTLVEAYPFTLYCRVKKNGDASEGDSFLVQVVDKDDANIYYAIGFDNTYHPCVFARNTTFYQTSSADALSASTWHAIVCVFQDATHRLLYVDGVYKATGTDSVTLNTAIDRVALGRSMDSTPSNTCNSTIGEAAGFSDALTTDEITEISTYGLRGDL